MDELVLDAATIKALRDALGMTQLENEFLQLAAYTNQLHSLVEALAGEATVEAQINAASGPQGLQIQRNIAQLPKRGEASKLRHPSRMNLPSLSEVVAATLMPNVNYMEAK